MSGKKVLIVGAGIGGLAAAIALSERGWATTVVDVKSANTTVGVGLNHPANALRALRDLGVYDDVLARGYVYRGIKRYTPRGDLIAIFEPESPPDVPFQVSMTRADLHDILMTAALKAGADIHLSRTWSAAEERPDGVVVTFDNGDRAAYDLMIGADGIRSPLRRRMYGDTYEPVFTGYVCWRMAAPRPTGLVHSEYFNGERAKATVIHLNPETMYLLVVEPSENASSRADKEQFAEELRSLLDGFPGVIADVREQITADSEIHRAALEEVTLGAPWYRGRTVLIGDAAHAVTPHLAQGAGMAMEDALVLADELERNSDIDMALANFMDRRQPRVTFVQDHAHEILMNEMESDAGKRANFAAGLGARQAEVTRALADPP